MEHDALKEWPSSQEVLVFMLVHIRAHHPDVYACAEEAAREWEANGGVADIERAVRAQQDAEAVVRRAYRRRLRFGRG